MSAFLSCARYTAEREIPGEVARRRAKIASASSRASWLVLRVRYQSRIPRLRANAELECTWELDWSRRGGPQCRRKPARPEYNISARALAPLGASEVHQEVSSPPFRSGIERRGRERQRERRRHPPSIRRIIRKLRRGGRTLHVAGITGDPGRSSSPNSVLMTL